MRGWPGKSLFFCYFSIDLPAVKIECVFLKSHTVYVDQSSFTLWGCGTAHR